MRVSTAVMLVAALVFVVPLPGTFVLGAVGFAAGVVGRVLGV